MSVNCKLETLTLNEIEKTWRITCNCGFTMTRPSRVGATKLFKAHRNELESALPIDIRQALAILRNEGFEFTFE